ncbi:MAG: NAD(P)/FAD-dependent oxidoreductase [Aestuariivirga sp.]
MARARVVILGAGFGGLNAALALRRAPVDVTLIDQRNYHLFQPLLYQVATAALSPAQIATPIRKIFAGKCNTTVLMDKVLDVDLDASAVVTAGRRITFDYLIVATGARHAYFGHENWEKFAPGLKEVDEAIHIRRRVLIAFERAEAACSEEDRRKLLTFAVVGAGPTGVELAGAIAELARKSIVGDFSHIDPSSARIVLVEAGPRALPSFPDELSASAENQLRKLGVEFIKGDAVTACDEAGLALASGTKIETSTIIWAAGVMASPAAKWLKAKSDRAGRVEVSAQLKLEGRSNIFVIGDTAAVKDGAGRLVPGVAPAAKQMGRYVAKAIVAELKGGSSDSFVYKDYGSLATIGRKAAVADFGRFKLSGFSAWIMWSIVHLGFLIGFRNRFTVMLDWAWAYITHNRGARLITGSDM